MKFFLYLIISLTVLLANSQDLKDLDENELRSKLEHHDEDIRAKAKYYLGKKFLKDNPEQAITYLKQSANHFKKLDQKFALNCYNALYKKFMLLGLKDEAGKIDEFVMDNFLKLRHSNEFGNYLIQRVNTALILSDLEAAKNELDRFEKLIEEYPSEVLQYKYHSIKGNYHYYAGDIIASGKEFKKAIDLSPDEIEASSRTGLKMNYAIIALRTGDTKSSKMAFRQAIVEFREQGSQLNEANAILNLASVFNKIEEYDSTIYYCELALDMYTKSQDTAGIINTHEYLSDAERRRQNLAGALEYEMQALELIKAKGNATQLSHAYGGIAIIYEEMRDQINRLKFIKLEMQECIKVGTDYALLSPYSDFTRYYQENNKIDSAIYYGEKLKELAEKSGNKPKIANAFLTLGTVYKVNNEPNKALDYYVKSFDLFVEMGDEISIAGLGHNIGVIYFEGGQFDKALKYIQESFKIRSKINNLRGIVDSHKVFANIFSAKRDWKAAYDNLLIYSDLKDTLFFSETMNEKLAEMQTKFQTRQIQDSLSIQQKESESQAVRAENAELAKNKADAETKIAEQRNYVFFGLTIVLLLGVVFVVRTARQRKKSNIELTEKNRHIQNQNSEIIEQRDLIKEKNKDILDSISYAKRLQDAILPPIQLVKENLKESFILFKPKDIVSGDFYWMLPIDGKIMYAAVDCTGHGVPGAMVSVVGHNGLNQAIKEFGKRRPSDVLNKLNELVIETFRQEGKADVRDGMDIALCSFDEKSKKLEFSGANNPVWVVSKKSQLLVNGNPIEPNVHSENGLLNLFEIKGNKQPIGPYEGTVEFINHEITLDSGDSIYTFSDGYPDQFGGAKGKKLKYSTFKKLLLGMNSKAMGEQRSELDQIITEWMADYEQVDDICIIGVRT